MAETAPPATTTNPTAIQKNKRFTFLNSFHFSTFLTCYLVSFEIVHHLRSSFDHLIWKLIEANNIDPSAVRPRCEFPIYLDWDKYVSEGTGKIKSAIKGSSALIEQLQPRGDADHPLWLIHNLDITDKHKLLLVINGSLYKILQILSVNLFEKTPLLEALTDIDDPNVFNQSDNQLNLFN